MFRLGALAVVFATATALDAIPPQLSVVPYPSDVSLGNGAVFLEPSKFHISLAECTADCDIIDRAIDRYLKIIFLPPGSTNTVFRLSIFENRINQSVPTTPSGQLFQLDIITKNKSPVELQLGVDESYELNVPSGFGADGSRATLTASTAWGALRGLETFAQIVSFQTLFDGKSGHFVYWTPMSVRDAPRYPWRGLLIDSARHYLSVPLLEKTIDTMAAMKLNTLHWHMVDAESFPFASVKYPELQKKATYHPTATYTSEIISHLINFARDRGVRILPELDTPGHTAAIGQAYPELIADCYDWLVEHNKDNLRWPMFNNVALDVTKDATKVFAEGIINEMAALFPDKFFHLGGDEVNQGCWNAVPTILTWMQENGFATFDNSTQAWTYDFTALQGSWTTFVQGVTANLSRRAVVWEESFTLGFDLAKDTVVHVWLPDTGTDVVRRAIEAGHNVILSNGWYLDRQAPTCVDDAECSVNWMWMWSGRDMYAVEPLLSSSSGWVPTEEQAVQILGGEAASWGESVDDKNFDARVWSRTPGIAERLWSPSTYTDPWDLQPRISALACNLARRGVGMADSQPAFCDYY